MKPHYCPVEKSSMTISGCCNWCGAKEPERVVVIPDRLAWVMLAVVIVVLFGCVLAISFFIGKLL
tara:strand:+ start:2570 stop:2764 length:195 start_codon:yes stop_codon:yes gene_type:complete